MVYQRSMRVQSSGGHLLWIYSQLIGTKYVATYWIHSADSDLVNIAVFSEPEAGRNVDWYVFFVSWKGLGDSFVTSTDTLRRSRDTDRVEI